MQTLLLSRRWKVLAVSPPSPGPWYCPFRHPSPTGGLPGPAHTWQVIFHPGPHLCPPAGPDRLTGLTTCRATFRLRYVVSANQDPQIGPGAPGSTRPIGASFGAGLLP